MSLAASIISSTLNAGTPLLLAAVGILIHEKSGVLNLGIEGIMLMGAVAGFGTTYATGSFALGFLAGAGAGLLFGLLFAFFTIAKMLCRKPFSPLHKQSHFISLYRETRSLQSTGSILNCFATIADSQRDMEQHRVNIHTFVFTFDSCTGETGSYDFLTQILYILHHRF